MVIKHPYVCPLPDDPTPNSEVKPSHWNQEHRVYDTQGHDITTEFNTMLSDYISGAIKGSRSAEYVIAHEGSPFEDHANATINGTDDADVFNEALEEINMAGTIRFLNNGTPIILKKKIVMDFADQPPNYNVNPCINFGNAMVNHSISSGEAFLLRNKNSPAPNVGLKNFYLWSYPFNASRKGIKILDCQTAPAIETFQIWGCGIGVEYDLTNRLTENCWCEGQVLRDGTIGNFNIGVKFNDSVQGISPPVSYDSTRFENLNFVMQQDNSIGIRLADYCQFLRCKYQVIMWMNGNNAKGMEIRGEFRNNLIEFTGEISGVQWTGQTGLWVDDAAWGSNNRVMYDMEGRDYTKIRSNIEIGLREFYQTPYDWRWVKLLEHHNWTEVDNLINAYDSTLDEQGSTRQTYASAHKICNSANGHHADFFYDLWFPTKDTLLAASFKAWADSGNVKVQMLCGEDRNALENVRTMFTSTANSEPANQYKTHVSEYLRGRFIVLRFIASEDATMYVKLYDINAKEMPTFGSVFWV